MDRMAFLAMTGAKYLFERQALIAQNLANVATAGYRAETRAFRAAYLQGAELPTRAFAVESTPGADFTPGPLHPTGRNLDVAIEGKGWIAVEAADGSEAYTRNGSLEVSVNGILQTRTGIPVQGDGGPITVPPDVKITIGKDGTVSVIPETGAQNTVNAIGRIKLVNPPEAELVRGGDGLFRTAGGDPAPADERTQIASGYLEGSNVNPVDQMVTMISLARQFEMQVKMMQSADTNDRAAAQVISSR
jgi:flagellar basal-body rod protein FlgF